MTTPASGPSPTPPPQGPSPAGGQSPQSSDEKDAYLLQSPFAKMFRATGHMPTAQEMKAMMNGILMQAVNQIKQQDQQWKKAMQKLKEQLEGKDS
jgi:hypothetical protein